MMVVTTSFIEAMILKLQSVGHVSFVLFVLSGIAAYWLFNERMRMKRYAADIFIRDTCYYDKKTLGTLVDRAGTKIEFVCEEDPQAPGLIDSKYTLVNPNLVSTKNRGRLTNGIPTLEYVLPYHFPMSHSNASAIVQLRDMIREKYPKLDWIQDDLPLLALVFSNNKYLVDDCELVVKSCLNLGVDIPSEMFGNEEMEDDVDEL